MKNFPLVLLAAALFLAGCSSSGPSRTPLIIYSPHGRDMLTEFEREFETRHPDIDVQWMDMGAQDVFDRVRTERQNPQADLWWGGPMTDFERAAKEGLLEHFIPTWDSAVSSEYKSSDGFWYGTYLTPEVIMYNSSMIQASDAPRDWDDLLRPRWKGNILLRYPLASGTMRIVFSALIQRANEHAGNDQAGYEWLKKLDANTKTYVADPSQLYQRLARQEASLSIWNLPDVMMQTQKEFRPFGYIFPSSGTPVLTEGIAIIHGAQHLEAAQEFYEFVTSKESMITQANRFFRIPTRLDLPADRLPQWISNMSLKPMHVSWKDLAAKEQQWMQYWDENVKGKGSSGTEQR